MGYENYKGSTSVISGLIQENNKDFPIVRACDVLMPDGSRLDENELGGSGLPDYTEADNGKFLMIENGAPAWVLIEDGNKERY